MSGVGEERVCERAGLEGVVGGREGGVRGREGCERAGLGKKGM